LAIGDGSTATIAKGPGDVFLRDIPVNKNMKVRAAFTGEFHNPGIAK